MANKTKLGKIRKNVQGFDIREMLSSGLSTGFVGLYRGKKLVQEYPVKNIDMAIRDSEILAENSRQKNNQRNDYLRRSNPVRIKNITKKETGKKKYLERIKSK